jgi:hypothetical protein
MLKPDLGLRDGGREKHFGPHQVVFAFLKRRSCPPNLVLHVLLDASQGLGSPSFQSRLSVRHSAKVCEFLEVRATFLYQEHRTVRACRVTGSSPSPLHVAKDR